MLLVDDLAAGGTKNLRHTPRGLVTLWSLIQKNAGTFALTFRFLTLRPLVPCLKINECNVDAKQVTDVSLVLKDCDTESQNLSSLVRLSVSDGQRTDTSSGASFIGI